MSSPRQDTETARWFAAEVQPYEPTLRAWLRARLPSLADVDDLVQESYARLMRAHATGKIRHPKSYLFATARHATFDLFRRNRIVSLEPLANIELSSVLEDGPDVAETLSNKQEFEILKQAIDVLPARCRVIMTLQKLQGLPNREIAQRLGISVHTVNAQLVIGLVRCREYLRARGVLRGPRR